MAWDTIGVGVVIFYVKSHQSASDIAQVFFWIGVTMTLLVSCGGIWVIYTRQGQQKLDSVTGAL